jgi:hypothetical protein
VISQISVLSFLSESIWGCLFLWHFRFRFVHAKNFEKHLKFKSFSSLLAADCRGPLCIYYQISEEVQVSFVSERHIQHLQFRAPLINFFQISDEVQVSFVSERHFQHLQITVKFPDYYPECFTLKPMIRKRRSEYFAS